MLENSSDYGPLFKHKPKKPWEKLPSNVLLTTVPVLSLVAWITVLYAKLRPDSPLAELLNHLLGR